VVEDLLELATPTLVWQCSGAWWFPMLTLDITPVVHIYMERGQGMSGGRKRRKPAAMHEVAEPAGALGD
jgi:hypothetical protein